MEERPQKSIVLHIGDAIKYNPEIYSRFSNSFTVIRPSVEERQRPEFIKALKEKRWGEFAAIFRPFWTTGGEMGRWDRELISYLPSSVKVFASAGAGFDWADVDVFAEQGMLCSFSCRQHSHITFYTLSSLSESLGQLSWARPYTRNSKAHTNIRKA